MRRIAWFLIAAGCLRAAAPEYSVYLGSANGYRIAQLVNDASGNTYVSGSRNFTGSTTDVFLAKLDTAGNILFMTTFSGKGTDIAKALALDRDGNIYVAGTTTSPNFPLRNALQTKSAGFTGFLVKLAPDGGVIYSTYLGGTQDWSGVDALAVDAAGNVYAGGGTSAPDFPQSPGFPGAKVRSGPAGVSAAFVAKIPPAGDRILYSAVFAGTGTLCTGGSTCFLSVRNTAVNALALDAAGNVYFSGNTNSPNIPTTTNALVKNGAGGFVGRINAAGTGLDYLTYLSTAVVGSNPYVETGTTIGGFAVDAAGNAYVAGGTTDSKFPVSAGAYQTTYAGQSTNPFYPASNAFALKLSPDGGRILWATYLGGRGNDAAKALALDPAGNVWLTGTTQSPEFPNANGWSAGGDFIALLNAAGSALPFSARYPDDSVSQSLAVDQTAVVHMAGVNGIVSTLAPGQTPTPRVFGVANIAAGTAGGMVAPGEILSIFGPDIGAGGNTQVLIGGIAAPLLYVSPGQINTIAPWGIGGQDTATVSVLSGNVRTPDFNTVVIPNSPGIFKSPAGLAAAINQDGTVNSAEHPAKYGSIVAIWVNGVGTSYPPPADGAIQTTADDYSCCTVQVEDKPADVLYGGAAPGMVAGISQVNFRIPANTGVQMHFVLTSGQRSDSAFIYVAP